MLQQWNGTLPEQCFPRTDLFVRNKADIVKVGEVGVYLDRPVGLGQDNRADIEERQFTAHEWPILHPRNHIVQGPRYDQSD